MTIKSHNIPTSSSALSDDQPPFPFISHRRRRRYGHPVPHHSHLLQPAHGLHPLLHVRLLGRRCRFPLRAKVGCRVVRGVRGGNMFREFCLVFVKVDFFSLIFVVLFFIWLSFISQLFFSLFRVISLCIFYLELYIFFKFST